MTEAPWSFKYCLEYILYKFDGLVQERRNSIASTLELCLSCTKPLLQLNLISVCLQSKHPNKYSTTPIIFLLQINWNYVYNIVSNFTAIWNLDPMYCNPNSPAAKPQWTAMKHNIPDSKVHGANMGPIWGRQDPGGPHFGAMNFAIWVLDQL